MHFLIPVKLLPHKNNISVDNIIQREMSLTAEEAWEDGVYPLVGEINFVQ